MLVSERSARALFKRVRRGPSCWLWVGRVSAQGYGLANLSGLVGAHRVAWVWKHDRLPVGLLRNECGNRLCVNPGHWRDEGPKRVGKVEARRLEVGRLYRLGLGIGEISDRVGCSRTTVWRHLRGIDDPVCS